MQSHAGGERDSSESAHVGKRLQRTGATIEPARAIDVGAERGGQTRPGEQLDRRAASRPLSRARDDRLRGSGRVRRLDPSALRRRAVDAMFRDQREDAIGCAAREPHQHFAALAAEARDEFVRIVLQAGYHLTAVASGSAVPDLLRFEHDDPSTSLGERERAGKTGVARADDCDIGLGTAFECDGRRRWSRGRAPERLALLGVRSDGRGHRELRSPRPSLPAIDADAIPPCAKRASSAS